jgi:molybdopterin synthase sulfur carrier subunit
MTGVVMAVRVRLPGVLAEHAGGNRTIIVEPPPGTVADLLDLLETRHPRLCRRLRDETGAVRRHVNIYVDGLDVRGGEGLATVLSPGAEVQVLPSVAGG